jgi:hypothetical protein
MEKLMFYDTDSSTSTVSEDYLENYYPKKSDELKTLLIKPILPKPFNDPNTGIEIDDCFELSILRFFHLIFGSNGIINFTNLTKYMDLDNKDCQELYEFFLDNPGIFPDYEFYYSYAGIILRKKWVDFLSGRNFEYKKDDSIIYPNIKNQIKLLETFFLKLNINYNTNNADILQEIYSQLNFNWDSLTVKYDESDKQETFNQYIYINKSLIFVWSMTTIIEEINNTIVYSNSELRYS